MRFERDDAKAAANLRKHWVSFEEAAEVFYDPYALGDGDAEHSYDEERFFVIIISARLPTPAERKAYEEQER